MTDAVLLTEPLLTCDQRFALLPIQHPDVWHEYRRQLASFWVTSEIDLSRDRAEFHTALNDDERRFVKHIITFFLHADTIVSLNVMDSFTREVKMLEAQYAYTFQAMMENIHSEMYATLVDVYIEDAEEKASLQKDLQGKEDEEDGFGMATIREKIAWAQRWRLNVDDAPFANRLLAFCILEGVLFSGAFCAIYWFKQMNKLPGLTKSNEFIARDEGMHTEFGCLLYSKLLYTRLSQEDAHAMFQEAVDIEKRFIIDAIPCRLIGMNSGLMAEYIEHVADGVLVRLGYDAIFGTRNPFPFMDLCGMQGKSNFFEERVSTYQSAGVMDVSDKNDDGEEVDF